MFKRRDWAHMHGQDGEGSSDDDSSDGSEVSEQEASASGSDASDSGSEAEASAESDAHEEVTEVPEAKRLQDLSEDDFEEAEEASVDVEELVQTWLTAPEPELLKLQGPPLRCRWCPGTLMLNAIALKNHVESKRHQRRHKPDEDQPQPICLAEDMQEAESEGETHAERLERLRQLAAPPQLSKLSASQRRRMIRKLKAEQRRKLPKVKPGKRQRAELKAQIFGTAQGKVAKQKKKGLDPAQNLAKKKAMKAKKQKLKGQKVKSKKKQKT